MCYSKREPNIRSIGNNRSWRNLVCSLYIRLEEDMRNIIKSVQKVHKKYKISTKNIGNHRIGFSPGGEPRGRIILVSPPGKRCSPPGETRGEYFTFPPAFPPGGKPGGNIFITLYQSSHQVRTLAHISRSGYIRLLIPLPRF